MKRDWVNKLFVERSDLFLRLLNQRWTGTEELVDGMTKVLNGFGIKAGHLLDLCCGNGRSQSTWQRKGSKLLELTYPALF